MRSPRLDIQTLALTVGLLLLPMSYAYAQVPAIEREALIALYNSTDGDNWDANFRWLGDVGTECTWWGVTCAGGNVQQLRLYSNHMNGNIPAELANLASLGYLALSSNQLSGSIPPEFGDLSNLTYLDLGYNQLSGGIPPELGNLSDLTDLALAVNQLSGSIPSELGNLLSLEYLGLGVNQLNGSIPPELGNLASLEILDLGANQLSGSIPPELGNLASLQGLGLHSNQLSGSIPPDLGNLTNLSTLYLRSNQLSGSIPPELGNLSSLNYLVMNSNKLTGELPPELENLSSLFDWHGLDLRWNALHSDDSTLIAFLNIKQEGGDWQSTQTIAPENVGVDSIGDHTVWLSWDAVSYQDDPGGYEVFSSPSGAGVWTSGGWTASKLDTAFPVTGLDPATSYDYSVATYTYPHFNNLNLVTSDLSTEVSATTADVGCAQPTIEISIGDVITLTVVGDWDSYLWSTGETTPSIVIDAPSDQWYWVTVSGAGPCEETAATLGPGTVVFEDGFESADTSAWALTTP